MVWKAESIFVVSITSISLSWTPSSRRARFPIPVHFDVPIAQDMIKQTEIQYAGDAWCRYEGRAGSKEGRRGLWWEEELQRKSKARVR